MGALKLFTPEVEDVFEEQLDVIAGFAFNNSSGSSTERALDFDFLELFDIQGDYVSLNFKACTLAMNEFGLDEEELEMLVKEHLIDDGEYLLTADFYLNEFGDVEVSTEEVSLKKRSNSKHLRRFFLVSFQDTLYMTTVKGLDQATMHYKDNSERNEKGLQFEDLVRRFL